MTKKSILDYSILDFNLLMFPHWDTSMEKSIHSREYALFLDLLRTTREQAGLTQQTIAARLDATQTFVSKCERGERRLDVVELHAWCAALGINMHDFVLSFEALCQR